MGQIGWQGRNHRPTFNEVICPTTFSGLLIIKIPRICLHKSVWHELGSDRQNKKIQNKIIEHIENALEINIKEFIEEFNFNTPITYSKYNNANDGCIYGYLESNNDSVLSRVLNKDEESLINGLRVCGSASYYGHSFESTYKNGYEIAIKTLKDIEKGE